MQIDLRNFAHSNRKEGGLVILIPLSLESLDFKAKDVPATIHHTSNSCINLRLELKIGRAEIKEWNFHAPHLARMKSE